MPMRFSLRSLTKNKSAIVRQLTIENVEGSSIECSNYYYSDRDDSHFSRPGVVLNVTESASG